MLLQPIEKQINGKTFILSKFPATAGREIAAVYTSSQFLKDIDYKVNESIMLKLMCYVGIPVQGSTPIPLTTRALVDNHAGDWETLVKIEKEMIDYNCGFLTNE